MPKHNHRTVLQNFRLPFDVKIWSIVQNMVCVVLLWTAASMLAKAAGAPTQSELIQDWKRLHEMDQKERAYHVNHRNLLNRDKPPVSMIVKVRPDRWLYLATFEGTSSLFARSPDYSFLLWRMPSKEEWSLREFEPATGSQERKLEGETRQLRVCRPLSTLFTISQNAERRDPTLYEVAQSSSFSIQQITPKGGDRYRVEFKHLNTSGALIVDRSRTSVVVQSTVRGGGGTAGLKPWVVEMKEREIDPGPGTDGSLRCRRIEYTMSNVGEPVGQHEAYEFSDYNDDSIADEEFALSHYGLPEPEGISQEKSVPRYLWLLIIAGILVMLAATFRILARRGAAPKVPA